MKQHWQKDDYCHDLFMPFWKISLLSQIMTINIKNYFVVVFRISVLLSRIKNLDNSPTRAVIGARDLCIFAFPRKFIFLKLKHNRFPSFANKIFRHVGECVGRPLWPHYRKIASLPARIPEDPTTIKKKFKRDASLHTKDTARQPCFLFINQVSIIWIRV